VTDEDERAGLTSGIDFDGLLIDFDDDVPDELSFDLGLLLRDLLYVLFDFFPDDIGILF